MENKSAGRWWPDIAVRVVAAVAVHALLCFTVVEGVMPGAALPAELLLFPLIGVLVVLGVVRAALRTRSGRPVAWWRPGAVTAALVVFFAFPWLAFPGKGMVALRANFAASQGALQDVVDRITDAGTVPSELDTGGPVWIGGFYVRDVDASCGPSSERLARHECPPEEVEVVFRLTGQERNGGLTRAVFLHYCGELPCFVYADSEELGRHWEVEYEPVTGASLFLVATWYLTAIWLLVVLVHCVTGLVRLSSRGWNRRR